MDNREDDRGVLEYRTPPIMAIVGVDDVRDGYKFHG